MGNMAMQGLTLFPRPGPMYLQERKFGVRMSGAGGKAGVNHVRPSMPLTASNLERFPIMWNRFNLTVSSPPDLIRGSMEPTVSAANMDCRIKSKGGPG